MAYALSTLGQGSTAHILMPTWGFNPTASSGLNFIEIDFVLHAADVNNGIGYIFGSGGSTQFSVSVDTAGALRFVTGSTPRIFSAAGFFVYGQRYLVRIEYNDTGSAATSWTRMYANGVQVGADFVGLLTGVTINQIGRYYTTRHSEITVYSVATGGGAGSYDDSWTGATAPSAGVDWVGTGGTRNLTITNATGVSNSWWFFYAEGGGAVELSASLSSANTLSASLQVRHLLNASLSSANTLSASLQARHLLNASLSSTSTLSASLTVSSGGRIFAIDVTGIPDGNYPVAIFNHTTGDFITRQTLAFAGGQAQYATTLTLGTDFSGYVISAGGSPANGAVIFGQVSNAP